MIKYLEYNKQLTPVAQWRDLLPFFSLSFLLALLDERPYKGAASVTTCLRCPRATVFKYLFPFAIDHNSMAFAILGTNVHKAMEKKAAGAISELRMEMTLPNGAIITGALDAAYLRDNELIVEDLKTWGSYPVVKAIGLEARTRPALDALGNRELYKRAGTKNGKKYVKGDPKNETYWVQNDNLADRTDATNQLNMYRIMLEKLLRENEVHMEGIQKVSHLRVFCIVRDGNTHIATSRGIMFPTYMIPIKILPDEEVIDYFQDKGSYIIEQMNKHTWSSVRDIIKDPPRMGTPEETMMGDKGRYICSVCPMTHICKLCEKHPKEAERETLFGNKFDIVTGDIK